MISKKSFRLVLAKEYLKFSSAHMTVFSATDKERLHGHNYQVRIEVGYRPTADTAIIDAREVKAILAECCTAWDERLLLPAQCPYLEILPEGDFVASLAFRLCGKSYLVPKEEALLLPLDNITVESLSSLLAATFCEKAASQTWFPCVFEVAVGVEETPGQSATSVVQTR